MTAPIFVLIWFWHASGLAFLLSLNFLLTRDYCILTRVEIFHIIAFFFQLATPSWNFNPGLKSHYNQPVKLIYPRNFVALRKHWLLMWPAGWCKTNKASVKSHFYGSVDDIIQIVVGANSPCTTPFPPPQNTQLSRSLGNISLKVLRDEFWKVLGNSWWIEGTNGDRNSLGILSSINQE